MADVAKAKGEAVSETKRSRVRIVPVLVAVTALVAVVTFALSALGLFGFGHDGMRLAIEFAWMVPLGVDLLSVAGMIATYALRNSRLRRRVYAWAVFGFAVAASVAGNEAHAVERHLAPAGMAAASLPPVFLALAVHLLIVVRRDSETVPVAAVKPRSPASGLPTSPAQVAGPKPRPAAPAPSTPAPPGGPTAAAAVPSRGRGGGGPDNRAGGVRWTEARQRYAEGESLAEILMSWGGRKPTKRTLENWTDGLREQHRQARAAKGGGGHVDVAAR
jgi:hypothetical protein